MRWLPFPFANISIHYCFPFELLTLWYINLRSMYKFIHKLKKWHKLALQLTFRVRSLYSLAEQLIWRQNTHWTGNWIRYFLWLIPGVFFCDEQKNSFRKSFLFCYIFVWYVQTNFEFPRFTSACISLMNKSKVPAKKKRINQRFFKIDSLVLHLHALVRGFATPTVYYGMNRVT